MTLQPQASFTVVRQIANHTDSGVYYVRAVIRNAYTDELIDTLDLTSRGSQRYSKNWQVPADVQGMGFYISIVTSVYTDSGYTTKSENYGDEETTYLVQDRLARTRGGGGGVDAYTVRRIIKEELDKLEKPQTIDYDRLAPKEHNDRTDELLDAVKRVESKIPKQVDLTPISTGQTAILSAIEAKAVTPKTDLSTIESGLSRIEAAVKEGVSKIIKAVLGVEDAVGEKAAAAIKAEMDSVQWETTYTTQGKKGENPKLSRPEAEPVPFDPSQLAI